MGKERRRRARKLESYIERNKFRRVGELLEEEPSLALSPLNKRGETALHVAAGLGLADCIEVILSVVDGKRACAIKDDKVKFS